MLKKIMKRPLLRPLKQYKQQITIHKIQKMLPFSIISLFLATFVWYSAKQGSQTVEMSFSIQLVFRNLASNMQITSETPSLVHVSGRIAQRNSSNFNPAGIQAIVDLTNTQAGEFQYTLTEENITSPEVIKISRISPTQINLLIEELIEKTLDIRLRFQGRLKEGYILKNIEITPNIVKLTGPKSILEPLNSIFTNEIDLRTINQSQDIIVHLDLPNQNLQFLDQNIDQYKAQITVESLPIRRRFDDVKIELVNQIYETRINPSKFTIFLEGPEEILNNLNASQLLGYIDLKDYEPGNYKYQPKPVIPDDIVLLEQWPKVDVWVISQKLSLDSKN